MHMYFFKKITVSTSIAHVNQSNIFSIFPTLLHGHVVQALKLTSSFYVYDVTSYKMELGIISLFVQLRSGILYRSLFLDSFFFFLIFDRLAFNHRLT